MVASQKTFAQTRKTNPCPVCDNTDGRCRLTDWGALCMVAHSGSATGYKHIGTTSDGLWAKWIKGDRETLSVGEIQEKQQRQKQREEWQEQVSKSLSADERDRLYRAMLNQLSLHPDDRADLQRRGLTEEQIEASGFKSVEGNHPLSSSFPVSLPGVSKSGRSLTNSQSGYLCPIKNVRGLIVGCQIRHRESDGGRYRWLSSDNASAHLPIGELPLAVHQPSGAKNKSIVGFVEGTGAKPFIAAQKLGYAIVGASGGQFPSSRQTLAKTLEALNPSEIIFYPDAGAIQNHSVLNQYQSTFTILEEFGYKVQIAWWSQISKDAPDIDELDDLSKVKLISPKSFWMRCKTIAIAAYQSLIKVLGAKDNALKSRAIEMESIELLQLIANLKQEQEILNYRAGVRVAMFKLGVDWNHPAIAGWIERQGKTRDTLKVRELRFLKEGLEALLPKPEVKQDYHDEFEFEVEAAPDKELEPISEPLDEPISEPSAVVDSQGVEDARSPADSKLKRTIDARSPAIKRSESLASPAIAPKDPDDFFVPF
jgi:hypothetical protein